MALKPLSAFTLGDGSRRMLDGLIQISSEKRDGVEEKLAHIAALVDKHVPPPLEFRPEGIPYLIFRKGDPQKAQLRVLIPAHVDTVAGAADWIDRHQLTGRGPEWLKGLGVYDMQSSVMNSVRLIRELKLPPEVCVYFAFTGDEETRSHCARHLVTKWPGFKDIDLVISSEIGPLDVPDGDHQMRMILGRKGILKSQVKLTLQRRGGHGAKPDTPSAQHEWAQLYNVLCPDEMLPLPEQMRTCSPQQQQHELLGKEELFVADEVCASKALTRPQTVEVNLKALLVPPSTLESALQAQIVCAKRLGELRRWGLRQIECLIMEHPNSTSYPPFCVSEDHPYVPVIVTAIQDASGAPPMFVGGHSNADENYYASGGQAVLSVPIMGAGAHSPRERVFAPDVQRNYQFFRGLLTQFIQPLIEAKRRAARSFTPADSLPE